ncbi:MAG: hypothetical protein O2913_13500 [Chloroflexi bacterium]|nr:hypothetical protein [Chloroflexota bacterium]
MTNEELRIQSQKTAPQIKIAGGIWVVGMMIIMVASVIWVVLAVFAGDYYSSSKPVRDAAEAGSGLLSQLAIIQGIKAWLIPLSFLGMATYLLGFGFAFANILQNVRLRGDTMAAALPELKARKTQG